MLCFLALPLALAQDASTNDAFRPPTLTVTWKKDLGWLSGKGFVGEHLAQGAPVTGWVDVDGRRADIGVDSEALLGGVPVVVPGVFRTVKGELKVSLCENGGTMCRVVELGFIGELQGKKGAVELATHPLEAEPEPEHAPITTADVAFEASKGDGKPVLIDFGAVWCPPCNLMAAQLLHDPADAELLSAFHLAQVDVDTVESWPLKSRYDVGGYPTLVVTSPDGTQLAQLEGYPGEEETRAWLQTLARGGTPEALPDADALQPAQALQEARRAFEAGKVGQGMQYIWKATGEEQLEGELRDVLNLGLRKADAVQAADLMYYMSDLDEDSPSVYAAAAWMLSSALTGDDELDRAHWTFLAELYSEAGDLEAARAVLEHGIASYPDEFTYHFAMARLLVDAEKYDEALGYAQAAEKHSYGDNQLRAVEVVAWALDGAGRKKEALELIDATLKAAQRPDEDTRVRTPRYIKALEEARADIAKP